MVEIVAKVLLGVLIKEGIVSPLWGYFFKKKYIERLTKAINDAISEFEVIYPYDIYSTKYPFYHSQILLEQLLTYRFFKKNNLKIAIEEFSKNKNVILPNTKQLDEFYDIFENKIRGDKYLKKLYIEENFKEQIFEISNSLNELKNSFDESLDSLNKLTSKKYEKWLNKFNDEIKNLRPRSALKYLDLLGNDFENDSEIDDKSKARYYFLRGVCLSELWEEDDASRLYLKAYSLDKESEVYSEKALLVLVATLEDVRAEVIIHDLLKKNEFNEIAWACKVAMKPNEFQASIKAVPEIVKKSQIFKTQAGVILAKRKGFAEIEVLLKDEHLNMALPLEISYANKDYWGVVSSLYYQLAFRKIEQYNLDKRDTSIAKNEELVLVNKVSEKFVVMLQESEKVRTLLHHRFIFHLSKYLLEGNSSDVEEMFKIHKVIEKDRDFFAFHLIYCLCQIGEYAKVTDLIENLEKDPDTPTLFAKHFAYFKQEKNQKAEEAFKEYLNSFEVIDHSILVVLIGHSDIFLKKIEEKEKFISLLLTSKKLETEIESDFLLVYLRICKNEDKATTMKLLKRIESSLKTEQKQYKFLCATFYYYIKEYADAISLLNQIVDENKESLQLKLLIEILNKQEEGKDSMRLLILLKKWRENFSPDIMLLTIEINLLSLLPDYQELEKTAKYAVEQYPGNSYFVYSLLYALHKLHNSLELSIILNTKISGVKFKLEEIFRICQLAIREKKEEFAFELIYPYAKDNSNKKAREFFFSIYSFLTTKKPLNKYQFVEIGLSAIILIDNNRHIIEVSNESIDNDPRVKSILNKSIGEKIVYQEPFNGQLKNIEITGIYDKFQSLYLEITEEIRNSSHTGMNVQAIELSSNDIKNISEQMSSLIGKESEFRDQQRSEILSEYNQRKISFFELCRSVFGDNFVECYYSLTSPYSDGFHIQQRHLTLGIKMEGVNNFVIDITSMFLLYDLFVKYGITYQHKFLLSGNYKEYIEDELFSTEIDPEEKMSLRITSSNIFPIFYPKDFKQKRIDYLNGLLNWIEQNTTSRPVIEKLNITTRLHEDLPNYDTWFETVIDTSFMANSNKATLISDDSFFQKLLQSKQQIISTEIYLNEFFPDKMHSIIIPYLLSSNYKGLDLDKADLMKAFDESFAFPSSNYDKALQNIPYNIFKNPSKLVNYLEFIREIYLRNTIPMPNRKEISLNILVFIIKGIGVKPELLESIITTQLNNHFYLLPSQLDSAIDDLKNAMQIVYHQK